VLGFLGYFLELSISSSMALGAVLAVPLLMALCLPGPGVAAPREYWAKAPAAVWKARAKQGRAEAARLAANAGGRTLRDNQAASSMKARLDPLACGTERRDGAAGPMWYANPHTAGCSRASRDLTYAHEGQVYTARKGQLIMMQCENWECPIPAVTDCYFNRSACGADEWCMVVTHEKWGHWAMGKNGHTPDFEQCGESYRQEIEAVELSGNADNATVAALKDTRDAICGSSVMGMASGLHLADGLHASAVWKPSHGRCVKYRQEGESCIPTLPTHGRFANAFIRRAETGKEPGHYPNGGTMQRPLACAPGLICTGPSFEVLPSTCVTERPADVCFAGPWWDSSRCPRTAAGNGPRGMGREWALESLRSTLLLFPSEVAGQMTCDYWTGDQAPFTADVRRVTHAIFQALWPTDLVGSYPTLAEMEDNMRRLMGADLGSLTPEACAAGAKEEGNAIAEAIALAGVWSSRPNLVWSLIHFVMHNQPAPMTNDAVAASRALASHLSENFWCNDCRGFFTVGVLGVVGLPPESTDGEAHARYWNLGHNIASEHVATTRGGHPWINTLDEAKAAGVANPFFVPYETSARMWRAPVHSPGA